MKSNKVIFAIALTVLLVGSCKQEVIKVNPEVIVDPIPPDPGTTDLSRFIAVGDSYTAGMQAGALFNDGQANSMAKIMATQFALAGGGTFNQPDINHENGFNSAFSSVPTVIRGRLVLFDPDGATDPDGDGCQTSRSAAPRAAGSLETTVTCPSTVVTPAMPAPYNTAQSPLDGSFDFAGSRAELNNYGVPGARIFHADVVGYGAGNPFFGRFDVTAASSMLGDAVARQGTFFMLYLGNFDILNYATAGAVGAVNGTGTNDMTDEATFAFKYDAALESMIDVTGSKGVVGTIPDITSLPYFTTVLWNQIEFKSTNCTDAATLESLNGMAGFGGYNAALDYLANVAGAITVEEAAKRKVYYAFGKNGILIKDENLADLTAALSAVNAALAPYGRVRQANAGDLITFSAGGVLGTCPNPPLSPSYVTGVSAPLDDQYVLLPLEIADIQARTIAFNDKIKELAAGVPDNRVAVADVNLAYATLMENGAAIIDGVTITPSLAPPTGAWSEDSLHPNSRGYAFTANVFIDAINAKFAAQIPKAKLSDYPGTGLPVNP